MHTLAKFHQSRKTRDFLGIMSSYSWSYSREVHNLKIKKSSLINLIWRNALRYIISILWLRLDIIDIKIILKDIQL